tara:strand:+ start:4976 stop:5152 length:177 start_codon:yes stop_codon:yes gene_type:complete
VNSVVDADDMQNDKIAELDERLRKVEIAIVEIATSSKWIKYGVIALLSSVGLDVGGMM